jgi:hypothetical protein
MEIYVKAVNLIPLFEMSVPKGGLLSRARHVGITGSRRRDFRPYPARNIYIAEKQETRTSEEGQRSVSVVRTKSLRMLFVIT